MKVRIKRVYEKPAKADGRRILVDRLWPRGMKKEDAKIDLWMKEIAPTTELRKWFSHDRAKWKAFREKYTSELKKNKEQVDLIKEEIRKGMVTLVYAAKDEECNAAIVLQEYLNS